MSTFYVDKNSPAASDNNPGTFGSPLKTLTKANSLIAANDSVLVHPGTYTEQITIAQSGTKWKALDLGVTIDCNSNIHNVWRPYSGNIWVTDFTDSTSLQCLYVDGVMYDFPALSFASMTHVMEPHIFIVENSFWQDTANKLLYLDIGGDSPNDHNISYGSRPSCFQLLSKSGCEVDGFTLKRSNSWGLRINGGDHHKVTNCHVTLNPAGGIRIESAVPELFNLKDNGAGGTLPGGTYSYTITAIVGGVESAPSVTKSITLGANRQVFVQWGRVLGASAYRIYGRGDTNRTLMYTFPDVGATFPIFSDDGSNTPDGTTTYSLTTTLKSNNNLIETNDIWQNGSHAVGLFDTEYNVIRGNKVHHNALHGVSMQYDASHNTVELNVCYSNWKGTRQANGIMCDNFGFQTPGSPYNIIQRNRCFRNEDSGISIYNDSDNCIVRYNLCYLNGDHGIDNFSAYNAHMIGNTVIQNFTAGLNSEGGGAIPGPSTGHPSLGIRMYNNVSIDNGINSPRTSGNYRIDKLTYVDSEFDYNLSYMTVPPASRPVVPGIANAELEYGPVAYKTYAAFRAANPLVMIHGVNLPPKFVNPDTNNYQPAPDSPIIEAGTAGAPDYDSQDINGRIPSGNPNLGAFHVTLPN